jgi:UDP-N-acetylglucosamine--N-acetylmuramyl-(pentapeptide) pyrophosphoryl-undecaprenol N-acetylglucosamine transferase
VVIACGGTGGHLFPGIAVAETLRERGHESLLLISEKQIDALATEGYGHLQFERLRTEAMPSPLSLKFPGFLIKVARSTLRCRKLIKDFGASAVLGMGGFTSTAPLLAGRLTGRRTFIHESNAIPGRANRLNAKFSDTVLVGFEACGKLFPSGKVATVGTPLRPTLVDRPDRAAALRHFGMDGDSEVPVLLVMGGSQGARGINRLVIESLPALTSAGVRVLHISGLPDQEEVAAAYEGVAGDHAVLPFCADIQMAYAAATMAICRSGASTLAELAHFGLPAILIPYPFAADDHQTRNAEIFSTDGSALLWRQDDLEADSFATRLVELLTDKEQLARMGSAMKKHSPVEASERVCDAIEQQVEAKK